MFTFSPSLRQAMTTICGLLELHLPPFLLPTKRPTALLQFAIWLLNAEVKLMQSPECLGRFWGCL